MDGLVLPVLVHSASIYPVFSYFIQLAVRLLPLILFSVFLAEFFKGFLGEERLRALLSGRHSWEGRFRAVLLGAVLPFCECGAFPIMVGLLQAGVPLQMTLTFFLISPIISLPAFFILLGLFGWRISFLYLFFTVICGLLGTFFLERMGRRWGVFREGFFSQKGDSCSCSSVEAGKGDACEKDCSSSRDNRVEGWTHLKERAPLAWQEAKKTLQKILPLSLVAMILASLLHTFVPTRLMEEVMGVSAVYGVPTAALAGIPIYNGDCSMMALVAPIIRATGAIGPGMAFIIAGSGTSISGLIFMRAIFRLPFLIFYVMVVLFIAILTGLLLGFLF